MLKAQRMLGWIEDTQIMRTWPVCWMHMEGENILVIDFISRMAEFMLDGVDHRAVLKAATKLHSVRGYGVAKELNPLNESYPCYCCPVMVNKSNHLGRTAFRDVGVGLLKLTNDQWLAIAEAQQHCVKVTSTQSPLQMSTRIFNRASKLFPN